MTSSDERLAQISRALQDTGLTSLVMGGHAVRYYGVDRNTVDFDFFTSAPTTRDVRERISRSGGLLANAREGPSWLQDARNLATRNTDAILRSLRSKRGFHRALESGAFNDRDAVRSAALKSEHAVSFAFILPLVPDVSCSSTLSGMIDAAFLLLLRRAEFATRRHLLLVEVVRRAYKRHAMEIDRLDKQSRLKKT